MPRRTHSECSPNSSSMNVCRTHLRTVAKTLLRMFAKLSSERLSNRPPNVHRNVLRALAQQIRTHDRSCEVGGVGCWGWGVGGGLVSSLQLGHELFYNVQRKFLDQLGEHSEMSSVNVRRTVWRNVWRTVRRTFRAEFGKRSE